MPPDFLIVVAPRSGTSSLNHHLRQHHEIHMARGKELHLFDKKWDRGIEWYRGQFHPDPGQLSGEATPWYMYDPQALVRIGRTLPGIPLIVALRNPIDQTYSRYLMRRAGGRERRKFAEAMADYEPGGRYVEHLRHLPSSPLHVLVTEELAAEPEKVYSDLCRFLGVDDGFRPPDLGRVVNPYLEFRSPALRRRARRWPMPVRRAVALVNNVHRRPPPLSAPLRGDLGTRFAPHNAALSDYLGRDLSYWWPPE